jgi:hypothetical protein
VLKLISIVVCAHGPVPVIVCVYTRVLCVLHVCIHMYVLLQAANLDDGESIEDDDTAYTLHNALSTVCLQLLSKLVLSLTSSLHAIATHCCTAPDAQAQSGPGCHSIASSLSQTVRAMLAHQNCSTSVLHTLQSLTIAGSAQCNAARL